MAEEYKQAALNHPRYGEQNRQRYKRVLAKREALEQKIQELQSNAKTAEQ